MASLPDSLRRRLENTVVKARDEAEEGARAALQRLSVGAAEPHAMTPEETELRTKLRAHARQLGDPRKANGEQEIEHLVSECAYEHWHRMLFARFLAENQLLIHADHDVPVTLAECEELAAEAGVEDGWALAARFAARMLPAIFRPDDPVLSVRLAPEHLQPLEKLLADLPVEVFTADDGLGWVYQFWQSKRKKVVNKSGVKIGADELPVVTQLFTEPYMVQFLLHNTLGAWWAGKVLARKSELAIAVSDEEELRATCALPGYTWNYLRLIRSKEGGVWRPAAGIFDGWPERAAEITLFDPCCGSGHFLVEAFRILVSLRKAEEGLSAREACAAVLRDNLFGLEIDERCTQIAAFNLALAAWTYPEAGGYRPLPELNIACSGLSVGAKEEEWLKLAEKDGRLRQGMKRLYYLFKDAPTLGSLIDPNRELGPQQRQLEEVDFAELQPLLDQALLREQVKRDAQANEAGIAAQGLTKAAALLTRSYTLVLTNVPYLGRGKQAEVLRRYSERAHHNAKADLATCFIERAFGLCQSSGSVALVTPQNWLFLPAYGALLRHYLNNGCFHVVARLGPRAFKTISGEVVNVALLVASSSKQGIESFAGIDVSDLVADEKPVGLRCGTLLLRRIPEHGATSASSIFASSEQIGRPLREVAKCWQGLVSGDDGKYILRFWELPTKPASWEWLQMPPQETSLYTGREAIIRWDGGRGDLHLRSSAHNFPSTHMLQRPGVAFQRMKKLNATLFSGQIFGDHVAPIVPEDPSLVLALWCFCTSPEYREELRKYDSTLKAAVGAFLKVAFDQSQWLKVASERFPQGMPKPYSDDPTQWIFHGHPRPAAFGPKVDLPWPTPATLKSRGPIKPQGAEWALGVAVVRLLSYRWPAEQNLGIELSCEATDWSREAESLWQFVDADGIVCIPPVRGEQPATERLQGLLAQAFGKEWSAGTLPALLDQAGFSGAPLEDWLRDGFFEQHCHLFHQRPFIWHIWDGRQRDGFAALVNYHKLDRKLLERLTFTVLGDWIIHQRQGAKAGDLGAEDRLAAAEALQKKLARIIEGEAPYDIFVRWKPLDAQPMGWDPDLNDGVRMNIRPFVEAGVLRKDPRIKWTKDRGGELASLRPKEQFPWFWKDGEFTGERVNDIHLTNAEKRTARAAGGK